MLHYKIDNKEGLICSNIIPDSSCEECSGAEAQVSFQHCWSPYQSPLKDKSGHREELCVTGEQEDPVLCGNTQLLTVRPILLYTCSPLLNLWHGFQVLQHKRCFLPEAFLISKQEILYQVKTARRENRLIFHHQREFCLNEIPRVIINIANSNCVSHQCSS